MKNIMLKGFFTPSASAILRLLVAGLGLPTSSHAADDPANFYPERLLAPFPMGVLGRPFGEAVVLQGKVVEGPFKGEFSDTEGRLVVQRINGIATQQGVVIRFNPITPREWWHELGHPLAEKWRDAQAKRLEAMKGKSFEMRGYERGEHEGQTPEESVIQTSIQSRGFGFRLSFQVLMMKEIPDVRFTPADFLDRMAEFEGRAETRNGVGCVIGQKNLRGWTNVLWNRVVTIRGVLDHATLPDLEQISLKKDRDLRGYYIVRAASWSSLDQSWKKPLEIPKAPPLTTQYLKSCGVKLDKELQKHFDDWRKRR